MSVITKDLGAVSAYGLALEAGYEGTEQEYAELLASYGTVAQEAGESAQEAEAAKTAAETAATEAQSAATSASGYKYDAQLYSNQANGYKNTARDAMTAAQSARDEAVSAKNTAVEAVDGFAAGAQQALDSVNEAGANWKSLAEKQAGNSEAWAVGQRGGADVPTTDATYHNNAKYYAEQASGEKTSAQTARQGAETAATNAGQSATAAAESASAAAESARTLTIDATLTQSGQAADAKETGDKISELSDPLNILYVSDGVDWTHYGVTLKRIDKYTFALYGTATAIGNFAIFNGATGYYSAGTPDKTIDAGTYTTVLDTSQSKAEWVAWCYTETTVANRIQNVVVSGATFHTTFTAENPVSLFIRFDKNANFGNESDPSIFKVALYNGTTEDTTVIEKSATAKDEKARTGVEAIWSELHAVSPYNHGPFCTYREDFATFYTGLMGDYSGVSDFDRNTVYSTVINKFDALMALDTAHITKTALGTASGTDTDGNSYTIYEYTFAPHAFRPQSLIDNASLKKIPVILIDGSIHGFEKNSTYGLYCFLYDLVNNYAENPVLQSIRNNVVLKVIPVVNPWGFDRNEYGNANGVNINRNFATSGWTASEAAGSTPFNQPESVIVRDWILANISDLMAYFNGHTNGMWSATSFTEANAVMPKFYASNGDDFYNRLAFVTERHIEIQTNKFAEIYNFDIPSFFGRYQGSETEGTASAWATETAKAVAMTFEMFNAIMIDEQWVVQFFSAESKKICSELIGNMIAQTIFEYSD